MQPYNKLFEGTLKTLIVCVFWALLPGAALATPEKTAIVDKIKAIEAKTQGRLGVFAINTANGHVIAYRANEVFPTGCTAKTMGVAAVLHQSMQSPDLLAQVVQYTKEDCTQSGYAPITEQHLSCGMTVEALCSAAISHSDNAAMNLLLPFIGGVKGITHFARAIGDHSFRQDHDWLREAYSGGKGNVHDASTPRAMVQSFQKITLGQVLGKPQKEQLTLWLLNTQTGAARIRAGLPKGWVMGHKTGTGGAYGTTNDLAILWPPQHAPLLLGLYYTTNDKKATLQEDTLAAATRAIVADFSAKDPSLHQPQA
ncbi:MAG: class A beta-lactamase [Holosporaceae bacterium]